MIGLLDRPLFFLVLVFAALGAVGGAAEGASLAATGLKVSHEARSLQPGEVVLMTVLSPEPLQEVKAKAFGKTFPFFAAGSSTHWRGLVGIDLDVAPQGYAVEVSAVRLDGQIVETQYDLAVKDKKFRTRQLTVRGKYVNPPAEELKRIRRESRQVAAIFRATSPDRFWDGSFLRPVPGEATSSFGVRSIFNGQPRSPHSGMDFRAGEGTPVKAPNAGKVVLADELYFSGNVVILDHGWGLYSYFAHLSRFAVSEGDAVSKGDVIGYVGATGRVTGPHLHWTMRLSGARVDPLSLVEILSTSRQP